MAGLLAQAQQMQAQLLAAQNEIAATQITGTAGNGLVTVTGTGTGEITAVTIDPCRRPRRCRHPAGPGPSARSTTSPPNAINSPRRRWVPWPADSAADSPDWAERRCMRARFRT